MQITGKKNIKVIKMLDIFNMTNFAFLVLLNIIIMILYFAKLNKKAEYLKSRNGDLPKEFIEEHISKCTSLNLLDSYEVLGFKENSADEMTIVEKALFGNGYNIENLNKDYDFSEDFIVFYLLKLKDQSMILMILSDIYDPGITNKLLQFLKLSTTYFHRGLLKVDIE
jgi:hypothetical protein